MQQVPDAMPDGKPRVDHRHGLPLTTADKRKIVGLIVDDKEWSGSAKAIADHRHVSCLHSWTT